MPGLEFSLPYNSDAETLKNQLRMKDRNGNRVREIYLSVPNEIAGSGRAGQKGMLSMEDFLAVVENIHAAGIGVDMTMNATCGGADWYEATRVRSTCDFVERMHKEHGVEAVTLANPVYIREVRKRCPELEISASVLAGIDCFKRAKVYAAAGATTVTVDTRINRDLPQLADIQNNLGMEVKLMVNEG
jgi:collagenase-like PrtC family protease